MDEDEEAKRPPDWHVLLLEKTFRNGANTVPRVAGVLSAVLGLSPGVARQKAEHARSNFFAVVATMEQWADAIGKAQALQSRGLVVRVLPGSEALRGAGAGGDEDAGNEPMTANSAGGRRS